MKHTGLKLEELDKKAVGALVGKNLGSVHKQCHQLVRRREQKLVKIE